VKWAPLLIDVFMDGNSDLVDQNIREVLGTINAGKQAHYFRYQVDLGTVTSSMDDASPPTIAALLWLADKLVAEKMYLIDHMASVLWGKA
jgi:hypothetical protein